jgi:hypothetical protein
MEKFGKALGAAKMDFKEARHYCKGASLCARRTAKRDLKRAMRREAKMVVASY